MAKYELSLFHGKCGHRWVGSTLGSFGCPVCGLHDGDHHLTSMEPIDVQVDDWGTDTWKTIASEAKRKGAGS